MRSSRFLVSSVWASRRSTFFRFRLSTEQPRGDYCLRFALENVFSRADSQTQLRGSRGPSCIWLERGGSPSPHELYSAALSRFCQCDHRNETIPPSSKTPMIASN